MATKTAAVLSQQEFIRGAVQRLGLTLAGFEKRISVSEKALDKWLVPAGTSHFRNMPDVV
jgi:hypothetical protein